VTYLTTSLAELWLNDLNVYGTTTDADGNTFTIQALADDATWDSPTPVDVSVQRWMTDGAVAATQGHENREIYFKVRVSAASSTALAAGEAALAERANQSATLAWTPPQGSAFAATSVFDVWTWHLEHVFDGPGERRLERMYGLRLIAKPWVRSENLTTAAAVPTAGAGTSASVDACTATTGWTGSPNAPTLFSATAVRETKTTTSAEIGTSVTVTLTRTGSVTGMGTTPYLAIDHRFVGAPFTALSVKVNGAACTLVGSVGTIRYWQVPAGVTSFTTLVISSTHRVTSVNQAIVADVYDVTRTSVVGSTSTHKMIQRHLETGGSVPTSGSVQIASPSATVLGNVLAYTCPDIGTGYSPPMRQYRAAGAGVVTADATMVSGARETLAGATYDVPAGVLREATYVVVARLNFTSTSTSPTLTVSSAFPGTSTVVDSITATIPTQAATGNVWIILGAITLPGTAVPADSQLATRLLFSGTSTGAGSPATLDELFLLDVTHGAYSLVTSVSPFTFTRLWLDSPDADQSNNRPQIYYGTNADRSDAARLPYSQIKSGGDHDLDPNGSMVFTVTDGVDDAGVTATYYKRWHTHAAA
jgi:hypothetical protein